MNRESLKDVLLYVGKWCGLFRLSRHATRKGLRILCYHGFGDGDEVSFRPGLFIRPLTFETRLKTVRSGQYPVLSLKAALIALADDRLPPCATVITVDDVFHGVLAHGAPLLKQYGMCATAYLTTYYCVKETPVFRLVVRYMLWKTTRESLNLEDVDPSLPRRTIVLTDPGSKSYAESAIIAHGEAKPSEGARVALASALGKLLDVDFSRIAARRTFNIVTVDEARLLAHQGVDLQLHTHRHRLPPDEDEVRREIIDNRRVLAIVSGGPFEHLCYPSGIWSPVLWSWLRSAGVSSAATCDPGLNYRDTPRLGLRRILDAEDLSQIRFEAEMSGFKDLLRRVRSQLKGMLGLSGAINGVSTLDA